MLNSVTFYVYESQFQSPLWVESKNRETWSFMRLWLVRILDY